MGGAGTCRHRWSGPRRTVDQWMPIPGYEGLYEASDQGSIRSLDRTVATRNGRSLRFRGATLSATAREDGHLKVSLSRNGEVSSRKVHQLVMEAFVGPCPSGREVCHGDGDPTNNRFANLRYDTHAANTKDRVRHGVHHHAVKTRCPQGHPLAGPNLKASALARGNRVCRACGSAHATISRLRKSGRPTPDLQSLSDAVFASMHTS